MRDRGCGRVEPVDVGGARGSILARIAFQARDFWLWMYPGDGATLTGMSGFHEIVTDLQGPTHELSRAIPETWTGFAAMHQAAVADGALPARVKELIAPSIAVAKECDGCIAYHAKAAARRGATAEEVAEALGVALLMNGGPASVYAPRAWDAYQEFAHTIHHAVAS
jgi:AhpD family alkylhydroperoxidase